MLLCDFCRTRCHSSYVTASFGEEQTRREEHHSHADGNSVLMLLHSSETKELKCTVIATFGVCAELFLRAKTWHRCVPFQEFSIGKCLCRVHLSELRVSLICDGFADTSQPTAGQDPCVLYWSLPAPHSVPAGHIQATQPLPVGHHLILLHLYWRRADAFSFQGSWTF